MKPWIIVVIATVLSTLTYRWSSNTDSGMTAVAYNGPGLFVGITLLLTIYLCFNIQTRIWQLMHERGTARQAPHGWHFRLYLIWIPFAMIGFKFSTQNASGASTQWSTGHYEILPWSFLTLSLVIYLLRWQSALGPFQKNAFTIGHHPD